MKNRFGIWFAVAVVASAVGGAAAGVTLVPHSGGSTSSLQAQVTSLASQVSTDHAQVTRLQLAENELSVQVNTPSPLAPFTGYTCPLPGITFGSQVLTAWVPCAKNKPSN
jgi:hypothetical protein